MAPAPVPDYPAACRLARRFHLGRLDLELPDRGRDARGRPRSQRVGHLWAQRPGRQPRYRRRRLRSLPSLSRRHRVDAAAWHPGLPFFRGLAARAAAGTRDAERAGAGVLRPADRRAARRRHRAMALPLPLGFAAGARRPRRLDDARLGRPGLPITRRIVAQRYGDRVKRFATFNEPSIFTMFGLGFGSGNRGSSSRRRCCTGRSTTSILRTAPRSMRFARACRAA